MNVPDTPRFNTKSPSQSLVNSDSQGVTKPTSRPGMVMFVAAILVTLVYACETWLDFSQISRHDFEQRRIIAQVVADSNTLAITSALTSTASQ